MNVYLDIARYSTIYLVAVFIFGVMIKLTFILSYLLCPLALLKTLLRLKGQHNQINEFDIDK